MNKIFNGDAISVLKEIPENYVDLTVTSPPYDSLRSYNGKISEKKFDDYFSFPFFDIANELFRVTKDGGIVVWVVNDQIVNGGESGNSFRQALKFQEIGFKIYDTMIYHKNSASFPETGRYSQVFEYMFVLLKGKKPNTVNLIKDKKNAWAGHSTFGTPSVRLKDGSIKKMKDSFVVGEYSTRYNVWNIVNGKGFGGDKLSYQHPASFPEALAEDHILSWSNEGDIVLDPMCGSGTTLKMAKLNNRNYIGIDINQEYVDLSIERLEKVVSYTLENTNPKLKYVISREEILNKRKKV
jgi:site-specific DNA-methyltransferase (adenine-specific)